MPEACGLGWTDLYLYCAFASVEARHMPGASQPAMPRHLNVLSFRADCKGIAFGERKLG